MIVREDSSVSAADWTELRRDHLRRSLQRHVDGEVRFDDGARVLYSTDASIYQMRPLGVVIPRSRDALTAAVRIALEQQVPLVPRGGGTSLSGQAIGPGLVIDCSKYLHRVVDLNLEEKSIRVEPGCVLGELNARLKPLELMFGPDVATIDRANIGGMIGNNSAGARSIRYGKTIDHVAALDVILSDGSTAHFSRCDSAQLRDKMSRHSREGEIYRTVHHLVTENRAEIERRFPKVFRRVSGYNLDSFSHPDDFNLARMIVGSEGTLAVVAEATLSLVPLLPCRAIAVVEFSSLTDAMNSLGDILATDPTAVELIDQMILDLARASTEYRTHLDFLTGEPKAVFIVEYLANEPSATERSLHQLQEALAGHQIEHYSQTTDMHQAERIWNVRKMALPLLLSLPGGRKPTTFVEDTAVAPERLGEYVERFREILSRHGTHGSFYGHASVGCLHIRPLLDLGSEEGVQTMRLIAEEVLELVMEFGGAMSGEHGDGLARSCFHPVFFGSKVYELFREVKHVFDPLGLLNPGKIVDAPAMTDNLRSFPHAHRSHPTHRQPLEIVQECNGNGLCRRRQKGVMCPSFMATHDEQDSPRGRANLLRSALEGTLPSASAGNDPWTGPELTQALDLCLGCKACKSECPSSVDIAALKSKHLHQLHRLRPPKLADQLLAQFSRYAWWGSRLAPLSNIVLRNWMVRRWLYPALGIDRRRRLPSFRRSTLVDWFRQHRCVAKEVHGEVVLLADCFTNWHEPQIGRAAVMLLELAGYQVHLAPICCGRTLISKGYLDEARDLAHAGVRKLADHADAGHPILGIEPSCILTLTDEWLEFDDSGQAAAIAPLVALVDGWLADQVTGGHAFLPGCELEPAQALLHGHCHQRAAGQLAGTTQALVELAGLDVQVVDSGCCGMAGAFGYEVDHYETSVAIAEQRLLPAVREAPKAMIVAPGFSCRTQIRELSGRIAQHPIEVIRRRLGATPPKRLSPRSASKDSKK